MKDFKNTYLLNEINSDSTEGPSFETSNPAVTVKPSPDPASLEHSYHFQSMFKRYSFDDNGGGYQGL